MEDELTEGAPEIIGQCRIEKKIGEGGMGSVYLGRHINLDLLRAVKILPKHIDLKDPEYSQRFFREARIAARLKHPNLVQVHECGAEEGYYYLVMDYVEGPTARELVEEKGRIDWREGLKIVRQVAEGLRYAASMGIIHRDVTPGNIIIDSDGTAKITDLGLAKETTADTSGLTRSGASLGTPYYMSPEQINSARDVDFRTDMYSLGATLYHIVCGTVPYTGTTFEVMTKQVREPLPSPTEHVDNLPDAFCDVLRKMMAKDPNNRYSSYEDLIQDFDNLLEGEEVSAAGFRDQSMITAQDIPAGAGEGDLEETQITNPPGSNKPVIVTIVVAAVLIALVVVLLMLLRG
jgi:serine/threonine protein kinase